MAFDTTYASGILKEKYLPRVRSQINNKFKALAVFEKGSEDVEGSEVVLSLHVTRHAGIGARAEGAALPAAGHAGFTKERVPTYNLYGRGSISGKVLRAARSDAGSFERALSSQTKRLQEDVRRDLSRQMWGTSNGVIATCGVTSASTTVVLATATGTVPLRQLEVGMRIDIGTVADPTSVASSRTISSINTAAKTMVISGAAVTTAGTDFIFRAGNGGAIGGAGQKEITGLQSMVDATGTLFSVDPSTYPTWSSYEDATGGILSDSMLESLLMNVEINSGEEPTEVWVADGVYRSYANTLKSQKRFTGTMDLRGGHKALSVSAGTATVPMIWERDVPNGTAFATNREHYKFNELDDWDWMDEDGDVLFRVAGYDEYEFVLRKYMEATTDQRNAFGKLTGLTES